MQPKIKKVSCFFRILFQIAFVVLPIFHIIAWVHAPAPFSLLGGDNWSAITLRSIPENIQILNPLSTQTKFIGFLIDTIPVVAYEFLLFFLIRLFRLYEKGEIFSLPNVRYIKKTGYALLIMEILTPICGALLSLVIALQNPPGHRTASLSLNSVDLATLLTALLIILVSWIMAEGCRLREEQQLTI